MIALDGSESAKCTVMAYPVLWSDEEEKKGIYIFGI